MITPTKGIAADRALLSVGAQILGVMTEPMSVSRLWALIREWRRTNGDSSPLSYAWFVLGLDLLFALGLLELNSGELSVVGRNRA